MASNNVNSWYNTVSDDDSTDSWGCLSNQSDFTDYCSQTILNKVDKVLKDISSKSVLKETLFTPKKRVQIKRFSHLARRNILIKVYNNKENINLVVKLVKYYNEHGYLNNSNSYKFINLILMRKLAIVAKKLQPKDVCNIKKGKLDSEARILMLAMKVRNRQLRRNIADKGAVLNLAAIINKLNKDYVNPYIMLNIEDGEVDDVELAEDVVDNIPTSSLFKTKLNLRYLENEKYLPKNPVYRQITIPIRNESLLIKLRNIIRDFINNRKPKRFREEIEMETLEHGIFPSQWRDIPLSVQAEMMDPEQTEQQQEAGPVVLNALQQEETDLTTENVSDNFWIENATSDALVTQKHAASMEILAKRFSWSTSDNVGKTLFTMDLPSDALIDNMDHPAAMYFGQYAYWHGDIKIRIHINTTPFHVGKLVFSWYYSQKFDDNAYYRDNIASDVLLPHVCYNASIGDDVVLTIPYKNYRSMLPTRKRILDSLSLYLGTLRCRVFNALAVNEASSVDGYVHVSFVNCSFTGISPRSTVQPEMLPLSAMVKTAERAVNVIDKISNMDNPSIITPPQMFTPQFTDSFSTGVNDVNNIHTLRLDPAGQTQHPVGSSTQISETNIKKICREWGLLRSIVWKVSANQSSKLLTLPVAPELAFNEYYPFTYKRGTKEYFAAIQPPVSTIASINAFNRGPLEYKFEIIASRYHTGALLSSFTPISSNVSIATALKSYNATMDIGNTSEYIFKVPYISERPYNPRYNREVSNNIDPLIAPIGELNLFVLNQLRYVTGTTDHVYINVYLRAGEEFEVAVPVSPLYSINLDSYNAENVAYVTPKAISNKPGAATWRYFDPIQYHALVGKFGDGNDEVIEFPNAEFFTIYHADYINNKNITNNFEVEVNDGEGILTMKETYSFAYMALFIVNGDAGKYKYGLFFNDYTTAASYVVSHYRAGNGKLVDSPTIKNWAKLDPSNKKFYYGTSDAYATWNGAASDFRYKRVYSPKVVGQSDEVISDPTTRQLASLQNGKRMFGEQFTDLKDYCRRFQPYCDVDLTINPNVVGNITRIPITPIGINTSLALNSPLLNIIGEGMIPFIASAFRFYRGGLRMKIIITNVNGSNKSVGDQVIYIQHKPDIILDTRNIVTSEISRTSRNQLFQTGYAYTAISTSVNNNITIEIPCYIPTNLLMLQKPDFSKKSEVMHFMMGCLDVFTTSTDDNGKAHLSIHYSIADDMDFSCFVGFPPVIPIAVVNNLGFENIVPEMEDEKPICSKNIKPEEPLEQAQVEDTKAPVTEGPFSWVRTKIRGYAKTEIREEFGIPLDEASAGEDSVWNIIKDLVAKYGNEHKHTIVSCISQIIHCVNNPVLSTFVIAIITFMSHLGIGLHDKIKQLTEWFLQLFRSQTQPELEGDDKTEISPMEAAKSSIIGSIVEASLSLYGKGKSVLNNVTMPNFSSQLFTNIRLGSLTINSIIVMFKNLFEVVPKIISWLGKTINPRAWYRWMFFNENKFIVDWVRDVEWVTDPNNRETVNSQVRYNYHIQLLVIIGRDLVSKQQQMVKNVNFDYIKLLNTKLNTLYNEISLTNISGSNIGVEPCCIAFVGNSQVGKTHMAKDILLAGMREINYQTNNNMFYDKPSTCNHWDGLNGNEPICFIDDFGHIKTDDALASLIGEFLLLKSKAVFTPPRAHLTDKGRKYSPLLVGLTMNEAFPVYPMLADPTAWQNRRDLLIHVEFVAPAAYPSATRVQDLPDEEAAKMLHAKFSIHKYNASRPDVQLDEKIIVTVPEIDHTGGLIKVDDQYTMVNVTYMNISQIKWYVAQTFKKKYERIRRDYLKDLELAKSFHPSDDNTFEVNLENYRQFIIETRKNMNSQERHTIEMAGKITNKIHCTACKSNSECVCDVSFFNTSAVGSLNPTTQGEIDDESNSARKLVDEQVLRMQRYIPKKLESSLDRVIDANMAANKLLGTTFDFLRDSHKNLLLEALITSFAMSITRRDIARIMAFPCPHTMLCFVGARNYHYTIDMDNQVLKLVYDDTDYVLDPRECECCQDVWEDETYFELYTCMLKAIIAEQHLEFDTLPDFLSVQNRKVEKVITRYTKRVDEAQARFNNEIRQAIDKSTWMGQVGAKIYSILRPLLAVTSVVAGIYAVSLGVDFGMSKWHKYQANRENRKRLLDAKADLIKTHEITDECIANKCSLCNIASEMAYDQHRLPKNIKKPTIIAKTQAEMAMDMKYSVDRKLKRNYFFLAAITPYQTEIVARCLGIKSHSFIALDHYIDKIRALPLETDLEIRTNNYTRKIVLSDLSFIKLRNSALMIGTLPRVFPQFVDIVSLFSSVSNIPNLSKEAQLYVLNIPQIANKIETYDVTWFSNKIVLHNDTLHVPHIVSQQAEGTSVDWYWSYQTSGKGLCGSVLISEMNITSPIIGIHIAGEVSGGRGYAEVVCRDTLELILAQLDMPIKNVEIEGQMFGDRFIPLCDNPKSIKSALEGDFIFMGTVPTRYAYNPPKESKCAHSLCYDEITKSTYDVPHLHQFDPRFEGSPMVNGCMHHVCPPMDFPDELFDIAVDDVKNLVLAKVPPLRHQVGVLSLSESVCGIPNIPGYDAMEFDTSEGFPFSSIRPKGAKDKRWLFDLDVTEDGYNLNSIEPILSVVMNDKYIKRKDGIIPMTVFTDCLKDLKLPKEKCHKTRIFSVSPVDFTIQFRQYFYDFTIAFQSAMLNVESAVGMNVDSYEWHDMIQQLLENSSEFVCGDYSKFGPRLMTKCVLAAFDIICDWYETNGDFSDENRLIRQIMAYETAHAKHLMLNMVYEVMCGAPSGCPITTVLNNFVNMIYLRVAYLDLVRKNSDKIIDKSRQYNPLELLQLSITEFRKYIKVFFYGDDLIMTVDSKILPIFNATNISNFFAKYNITFTDALKTGNVKLSTSVFDKETSFLKRNIKRHESRPVFVAAMDIRAIEETCNWVFKGHEEPEASIIACESMLLNAFGHGSEYYTQLRDRVLQFWRFWGEYPRIPTWKEVDWRIYEGIKPSLSN